MGRAGVTDHGTAIVPCGRWASVETTGRLTMDMDMDLEGREGREGRGARCEEQPEKAGCYA